MTSGTGTPTPPRPHAHWWDELALVVEECHERHSAAWWAAMRDEYLERFPDSDERSKANMRELADRAAARESASGVWVGAAEQETQE